MSRAAPEVPVAGFVRGDRTVAWSGLRGHWQAHGRDLDLREIFKSDPQRFERFSLQAPEVFADLSKQRWDEATRRLLLELAREVGLEARRDALLSGAPVNTHEGPRRAAQRAARPEGAGPLQRPSARGAGTHAGLCPKRGPPAASRKGSNIGIGGPGTWVPLKVGQGPFQPYPQPGFAQPPFFPKGGRPPKFPPLGGAI